MMPFRILYYIYTQQTENAGFLTASDKCIVECYLCVLREGLVIYILSKASFIYLNIEISMTEEGHEVNTSSECFHSSPWL